MDVSCQKMKPDKVIHYLRIKNILSRTEEDRLLQITSDQMRTRELLPNLINNYMPSIHQPKLDKGQMHIHIRNYEQRGSEKIPTKQRVDLTFSRWLLLELKREEIGSMFEKTSNGTLDSEEYVMH